MRFLRLQKQRSFAVLRSNAGQTLVDYLMITAVVAGIMIPIFNAVFGDRLLASLQGQRQQLVDFIAQSPKKKVPNIWFARERFGPQKDPNIPEPKDVPPPRDLKEPEVNPPRDIPPPKNLGPVGNVGGGGGGLGGNGVGNVGGGGNLGSGPGNVGGGGNAGGGGGNVGGGGNAGGGGGNTGLNGDFFNKGGGPDSPGGPNSPGTPSGSGTTKGRGGGGADDGDSGESQGRGDDAVRKGKGGSDQPGQATKEKTNDAQSKKSRAETLKDAEAEERARAKPFDWWLVIKILIVLLILFLLLLIGLSNMKNVR